MQVTHVFAGIPVADYESALGWYERLLGRPADRFPHDREAVWHVAETGLIYVVADAERAGKALVTLMVDGLDAVVAEIAGRGIAVGEIETVAGAVRRIGLADPDGNRIQLGQPLSAGA